MIERHLDISTADGAMNSFVVHPEEHGPHPVVLFYMDAPGLRDELRDMARRIAAVGYFVVLPNLYYRASRDWQLKDRTEAARAEMFALMNQLDAATIGCDTRAMLDFCAADPAADASRVGAVGYCMSGAFVVWAATAFADQIRCIAAIHGTRLVTDKADSPHRLAPQLMRCESYFGCGERDAYTPPEQIEQLGQALRAAGVPHRIEWYAGADHGFVFPSRGPVYQRDNAERHWERLFALFRRNLDPRG